MRKALSLPRLVCSWLLLVSASCSGGNSDGPDGAGKADAAAADAMAAQDGGTAGGDAKGDGNNGDSATDSGDMATVPAPTGVGCHQVTYTPELPAPESATLCIPMNARRRLGVVLVHGGGNIQGSRDALVPWQTFFVDQGAVTLNIDYYLIDDTTPSPVFPRVERNVKAAVQYLRANATRLRIAADRIVLLGTSAGARLGGVVHTTPDDPYFAGEGRWPGVSDRVNAFIGFYGGYDGKLATGTTGLTSQRYYGGEANAADPAVRERYAKGDARMNAAQAGGPVLLFHGDEDTTAPLMQSTRFDTALRAANINSTLVIVPGVGHSFDRTRSARRQFTPEGEQAAAKALQWLQMHFSE